MLHDLENDFVDVKSPAKHVYRRALTFLTIVAALAAVVFTASTGNAQVPVQTSPQTATGYTGVAVSYQMTADYMTPDFGPSEMSVGGNPGELPPGLSFDSNTRVVSGTPTQVGAFNTPFDLVNENGEGFGSVEFTILNPNAPVITSAGAASGTLNVSFSYQIAASNSPTSFDATPLPAGLSVNTATGLISGTPTAGGLTSATVSATNASGTGTLTVYINIAIPNAPVITSSATATGTTGVPFSYQITASNSPTSFSASSLPYPLTVDTGTGVISGTIDSFWGMTTAFISATNASGTGNQVLAITIVNSSAPVITSSGSTTGIVGSWFSYQITATNSPTSWGAYQLPAGLSVNTSTGLISGVPVSSGTTSVDIFATNGYVTGDKILTLSIGNISSLYNINAIYTSGTHFSTGGLDSFGNAYLASELGASATFNASTFTFGTANSKDGFSNMTVPLPSGTYTTLNMVGTASGGIAHSQTFQVNYTDGTNQQFTVLMNDWTSTTTQVGETKVVIMANFAKSDGTSPAGNHVLHGYTLTLNGHSVKSITLPTARGVVMLGFMGH